MSEIAERSKSLSGVRPGPRVSLLGTILAAVAVLFVAVVGMLFGVPTAISIGGGLIVLCFGSLWPIMWIASLLPPRLFPFIHAQHDATSPVGPMPKISIIAPARNEEPVADRLVRQFLDQTYDNWELWVVANNCTDRTAQVAREASCGDPRIRVVEATFEKGVKADALNMALELVEGEVVLELDSDNQVPADLLYKIACAFSDPRIDAVQTQIRAYNTKDSLLATFQDLEFLIYSEVWNRGRAALGLGSSIGGTGFAARRDILRELKGWTRDLVEDFEMHTRLVKHGVHVTYMPWAWVYDEKPISWDAILTQRKRWIRGHLEVAKRLTEQREELGIVDRFYLYSPVIIALMIGLFLMGYVSLALPNIIPGYAYFSPWFWLLSLGIMVAALSTTAWRAGDRHLVPLVLPYLLFFTFHWVVVTLVAVFPVSWAHSKTVHGVAAKGGVLPWFGIENWASARVFGIVLTIALVWQFPLWVGLPAAPSPFRQPILTARRSVVAVAVEQAMAAGVVQGTLTRDGDKPMPGAKIYLTASDGTVYQTRTDSRGMFAFTGIPAGQYHIDLNKGSWPSLSADFVMPETGGVTITADATGGIGSVAVVPIPY